MIIAVHNGGPFLRQALVSIAGQSYGDFELILIDDASTDNTSEIMRSWRDSRLRVISLTRNVGLAEALNRGLADARGEFIARMDADDVASPRRFMAQVERMSKESDLVLLGTAFDYIDGKGRRLRGQPVQTEDAAIRRKLFDTCNQFCHPSVMMRRDAVLRIGGYRTLAGRYAQDYDLWLRLAEVGAIANLPDVLLGYRVHKGQSSVSKFYDQRRAAELYKILARQRREWGFEDLFAAESEISGLHRSLRQAVASDCLFWSELFACMGNHAQALKMQGRALWLAPLSRAVHTAIRKYAVAALRGGGST